jgi:hypothetical protein
MYFASLLLFTPSAIALALPANRIGTGDLQLIIDAISSVSDSMDGITSIITTLFGSISCGSEAIHVLATTGKILADELLVQEKILFVAADPSVPENAVLDKALNFESIASHFTGLITSSKASDVLTLDRRWYVDNFLD